MTRSHAAPRRRRDRTRPVDLQHSAASVDHYSPPDLVERARRVLGTIDLDPASCALANTVVRADRFFTAADDGLAQSWAGTVFLNPPGCPAQYAPSLAPSFWRKLVGEHRAGCVEAAVFVVFSLDQLATLQQDGTAPTDYPFCVLRKRTRFLKEVDGALVVEPRPTKPNAVILLPPSGPDNSVVRRRFAEEFSSLGAVRS